MGRCWWGNTAAAVLLLVPYIEEQMEACLIPYITCDDVKQGECARHYTTLIADINQ